MDIDGNMVVTYSAVLRSFKKDDICLNRFSLSAYLFWSFDVRLKIQSWIKKYMLRLKDNLDPYFYMYG